MADATVICPICKSIAKPLDKTSDADGFDCSRHDKFKVADSVFVNAPTQNASREQWEAALTRAKTKAKLGEWPCIRTHDF
ncbi:hypothetical protein SAMN05444159_2079 [Bradyrhizobium lablabi]|uniref:Uncharacterized protein n=1 Tax=Bradyrhizobium lablabi TaxID=722472 RepID=A0A1M6NQP4_9BRAD|nr:hypothetical protein SAMN05444159_2079 [Bradyrhizobium lablabi]